VAKLEAWEKTGDEPPGASLEPRLGEVVKFWSSYKIWRSVTNGV